MQFFFFFFLSWLGDNKNNCSAVLAFFSYLCTLHYKSFTETALCIEQYLDVKRGPWSVWSFFPVLIMICLSIWEKRSYHPWTRLLLYLTYSISPVSGSFMGNFRMSARDFFLILFFSPPPRLLSVFSAKGWTDAILFSSLGAGRSSSLFFTVWILTSWI